MKWKERSRGMMEMLEVLNIKHEGKHHSGIDDVRNICSICIELIKSHGAKFPKK
jgi:inhibitor of KinA sporulation pathway (predicted exonuclease)